MFNCLVDLAETKRNQGIFLALAFVDRAFNQRNFYLAHCLKGLKVSGLKVSGFELRKNFQTRNQ